MVVRGIEPLSRGGARIADRTDLQLDDLEDPGPGTGFFYLVTAEAGNGEEGSLGLGTRAERSNVARSARRKKAELAARLQNQLGRPSERAGPATSVATCERLRELRSLGYVE